MFSSDFSGVLSTSVLIGKLHIQQVQQLPFHHRDLFDRIIIAQAICEKFTIMSDDKYFQHYDIELIR